MGLSQPLGRALADPKKNRAIMVLCIVVYMALCVASALLYGLGALVMVVLACSAGTIWGGSIVIDSVPRVLEKVRKESE